MKFSELIKQKREALGLTLQEVGDACGITKGHLHDLEAGRHRNPGLYTCVRLSVALGVSVQSLGAAIIETQTGGE